MAFGAPAITSNFQIRCRRKAQRDKKMCTPVVLLSNFSGSPTQQLPLIFN